MTDSADTIALSPHLDDAALSCGGALARRAAEGRRVLVITIFAGAPSAELTPLAERLHATWSLASRAEDALAERRGEDQEAMAALGVQHIHGDLVDAVYRWRQGRDQSIPAYPTLSSLFGRPASEPELYRSLVRALSELLPAHEILAPLAAGAHVDHRIVRAAAEEAFSDHERLLFFEDYPYAARPFSVAKALRRGARRRHWSPLLEPLGEPEIEARIRAVLCYRSQLGTVFRGERDLRRRITRFITRRGGERFWEKTQRFTK